MSDPEEEQGTAEVCDLHGDEVQVVQSPLVSFGGYSRCSGPIETFRLFEDNRVLKAALESEGEGRIAVVSVVGDVCAVVGDRLAGLAIENDWQGIIINGYLRDTVKLSEMPIAIWALGAYPRRSQKRAEGEVGSPILFGGVTFESGSYVYADEDGIVVAPEPFADIFFWSQETLDD